MYIKNNYKSKLFLLMFNFVDVWRDIKVNLIEFKKKSKFLKKYVTRNI